MDEKTIDAILVAPSEREELSVHLFLHDAEQFGEVYRDQGRYWIQLFRSETTPPVVVDADQLLHVISLSLRTLRERLEGIEPGRVPREPPDSNPAPH